jgi:hypothetical protein
LKNHFQKFILALTVLSIASIAAARFIFSLIEKPVPIGFYLPFLFFFLITILIYKLVAFSSEKYPNRFPAFFMGGTTIKLLAGLAFLVLYALKFPSQVKTFFVLFAAIYLVFTAIEIVAILSYLKGKKTNSQQ